MLSFENRSKKRQILSYTDNPYSVLLSALKQKPENTRDFFGIVRNRAAQLIKMLSEITIWTSSFKIAENTTCFYG